MIDKEVAELRRRYRQDRSNITKIHGCYVNVHGELVSAFTLSMGLLPEGEQEKYLELRAGLYEDLKTGIITQTDFKNFSAIYEKQYVETEKALARQEDMLKKMFYNGVQSGVKLERLKETMQITTLDRDTLLAFVDRIEVYEEKKVSVQFCYQEEMEKMLVLSEFLFSQSDAVKEVV